MAYDSAADTLKHIQRVAALLGDCATELIRRGQVHDASKLLPPEKDGFDEATPKLKTLVYGSEEYRQSLADLKPALDHHYAANSHHPEHYPDGVAGMDLFDLVEMVMDWKAASERQAGAVLKLDVSFDRFAVEPQLRAIIQNTADRLGWATAAKEGT